MARRRGFFAELQHQQQVAERQRTKQQAAAHKAQERAVAAAQKALRDSERASTMALKAEANAQKAAQQEAQRLHREAQAAEVNARNGELLAIFAEIDGILESTLAVDDYVDLEQLRADPTNPTFEPPEALRQPLPNPPAPQYPVEPTLVSPVPPTGLSSLLGGKRRHLEATATAEATHDAAMADWAAQTERLRSLHEKQLSDREDKERKRLSDLELARQQYLVDCRQRQLEIEEQNAQLDVLMNGLAFDLPSAIQDYVGIVLSNSVYPECFPVEHDFLFDLANRELTLTVSVPTPASIPTEKEYRYVQAKDEIVATNLPQKVVKDRYTNAIVQVAVRSLHEVFEADRADKIRSISLTVIVNHTDPATGLPTVTVLAQVAADKEEFEKFDLPNVLPLATLEHLGGEVSKNCYDLVPVSAPGIRRR